MYDSGPSEDELKAIGLNREDVTDTSDFEVWPENWKAFQVFNRVSSQWRMGPAGPTGLDYTAVFKVLKCMKVKGTWQLLDQLRALESSALNTMLKS